MELKKIASYYMYYFFFAQRTLVFSREAPALICSGFLLFQARVGIY